jgi:hypothetical protein
MVTVLARSLREFNRGKEISVVFRHVGLAAYASTASMYRSLS